MPNQPEIPPSAAAGSQDQLPPARAISRRRFLDSQRAGICGLMAFSLGAWPAGCTAPVRSLRLRRGAPVEIDLRRYPELQRPGGLLKVQRQDFGAIYVRCDGADEFTALSAVCTHRGGIVRPSPQGFRCPVHGSVFDRQGGNISGPAARPLGRFKTSRRGDRVVVEISEALGAREPVEPSEVCT
jgi:nitrite reductase/ring-hydroxylating ferredoxin subunit